MTRVRANVWTWSLLVTLNFFSSEVGWAESNFQTPDLALAHYIESANARSLAGINTTFLESVSDFNFSNSSPVEGFRIIKRILYTTKQARDWNNRGIIPPVAAGDVHGGDFRP